MKQSKSSVDVVRRNTQKIQKKGADYSKGPALNVAKLSKGKDQGPKPSYALRF